MCAQVEFISGLLGLLSFLVLRLIHFYRFAYLISEVFGIMRMYLVDGMVGCFYRISVCVFNSQLGFHVGLITYVVDDLLELLDLGIDLLEISTVDLGNMVTHIGVLLIMLMFAVYYLLGITGAILGVLSVFFMSSLTCLDFSIDDSYMLLLPHVPFLLVA